MKRALAFLCVALGACSSPKHSRDPLALTPLVDVNPDPGVVEVSIVASMGTHPYLDGEKPAQIWGYRDGSVDGSMPTIPGPLLEANAGDRVIVHFRNELPESTTVHWHGIRLEQKMDGSNASQMPIFPGDEYTYDFRVPDAGTFWYHPHMDADVQIENGLYGPMIVHGGVAPDVTADRMFMLDDVKLSADGTLSPVIEPMDLMVGRQGNVVLANGVRRGSITSAAGGRERWRFVNAANGRFFNLTFGNIPFLVIGWDGGLIPAPYSVDTLLVAPGERYEVLVDIPASGPPIALKTLFYDRGHELPDPGPLDLVTVRVSGAARPLAPLPTTWSGIQPLAVDANTNVRSFVLTELMPAGEEPSFYINGERWPFNTAISARHRAIEIWEIDNQAEMDHPFHLHGLFFQVLDRDGVPETRLGWKDTVVVPKMSKLRFAVQYTGRGMWMYHCHILEHAERGMMGTLRVDDLPSPTRMPMTMPMSVTSP